MNHEIRIILYKVLSAPDTDEFCKLKRHVELPFVPYTGMRLTGEHLHFTCTNVYYDISTNEFFSIEDEIETSSNHIKQQRDNLVKDGWIVWQDNIEG